MRIGMGYDVHRLVSGRPLVLGGIEIPAPQGLLGHSDADVLTHAIIDSMLGASGQGDIGEHFPDKDPRYAGISSLELLRKTCSLLEARGYQIVNIDATVIAEAPKLGPYKKAMAERLAAVLQIDAATINIKASTNEGLGALGRGEGIAALAVCSLAVISS